MPDKCPICLDKLTSNLCTISPCGHVFHKECLDRLNKVFQRDNESLLEIANANANANTNTNANENGNGNEYDNEYEREEAMAKLRAAGKLPKCPVCKRKAKKFVPLFLAFENQNDVQLQNQNRAHSCSHIAQTQILAFQKDDLDFNLKCHEINNGGGGDGDGDGSGDPDSSNNFLNSNQSRIGTALNPNADDLDINAHGTSPSPSPSSSSSSLPSPPFISESIHEHAQSQSQSQSQEVDDTTLAIQSLSSQNIHLRSEIHHLKSLSRDQSSILLDLLPRYDLLQTELASVTLAKSQMEECTQKLEAENAHLIQEWNDGEMRLKGLRDENGMLGEKLGYERGVVRDLRREKEGLDGKLVKQKKKRRIVEDQLKLYRASANLWGWNEEQTKELEDMKCVMKENTTAKEKLEGLLLESQRETEKLRKKVKKLKSKADNNSNSQDKKKGKGKKRARDRDRDNHDEITSASASASATSVNIIGAARACSRSPSPSSSPSSPSSMPMPLHAYGRARAVSVSSQNSTTSTSASASASASASTVSPLAAMSTSTSTSTSTSIPSSTSSKIRKSLKVYKEKNRVKRSRSRKRTRRRARAVSQS